MVALRPIPRKNSLSQNGYEGKTNIYICMYTMMMMHDDDEDDDDDDDDDDAE